MANVTKVIDMLAARTLLHAKNNAKVAKRLNRDYESQFGKDGMKIGDKVRLRDPIYAQVVEGEDMTGQVQSITENTRDLQINRIKNIVWEFSARELTLDIDRLEERYARPFGNQIANALDADALLLMQQTCPNFVGAPGTVPTSFLTYGQARAAIERNSAPRDGMDFAVITPDMEVNFVDLAKGFNNPGGQIGDQYKNGVLAKIWGVDFFMDQNCRTHLTGTLGSTPLANNATAQTGASIVCDGAGGAVTTYLKKGDKVTFDTVKEVNMLTKELTGNLRQFTVTADVASDSGGNFTIPISPSIIVSGPYQNCNVGVPNNDPVKIWGHASTYASKTSPQGMYVHKDAFTLAVVPIAPPAEGTGVAWRTLTDSQTGFSISYGMQSDLLTLKTTFRLSLMYGLAATHPEWACCIAS